MKPEVSAIPDCDIADFLARAFKNAPASGAGPVFPDDDQDATLRLLRNCVEAMGLMQAKVEELEAKVVAERAANRNAMDGLQVEISSLQAVQAAEGARLDSAEQRMSRIEVTAQEFAKRHNDDITGARTEAAMWRMRVETDAMAFDQLSNRMASLEQGLVANLSESKQTLVELTADNEKLKAEVRVTEDIAGRLRSRLETVDATIADQRARISCLQNKLATATYAMRFESIARASDAAASVMPDILDLHAPMSTAFVSAA